MSINMGLKEAAENLTVAEIRVIEKHFGGAVEEVLSGTDLQVATVWAYERRRCLATKNEKLPNWVAFDNWTVKELNEYFVEPDPNIPEELTDAGKDDTPDE